MTDALSIVSLGLDGDRVGVDVREAWALGAEEVAALLAEAKAEGLGACLLSTCYRVEWVLSGARPHAELLAWARQRLIRVGPDASLEGFVEREGEDATRHLIRVASGLESAVLGEAQILGQVRRARAAAQRAGTLTPPLRAAMDAAVRTGQSVRRTTDLGRGAASTASASVRIAEASASGVRGRHVLVIGGGQMGRLLMGLLPASRPASVTLVSAHVPPHPGFSVVRPAALADVLPAADVVFAATDREAIPLGLAQEAWADGRARTVVDLGVPRNVPLAVGALPGVSLHDIDALGAVVDAGLQAREAAIPEAEAKVATALDELRYEMEGLRREAFIADLRREAEAVRQETVAYVCGRCTDRTCEPAPGRASRCSDPQQLTRTLTTRLFHDLTASLRQRQDNLSEDDLRRLFALDDD
ncbi:NAD(P)-dependent oxidoreductase [Rubricoccus marinus]|uniref:Glutamyl-tRNA reductase n=1 Tax=Rubricoccus marinus TaxID=716817 RepID=A0A259U283_9BACT|nr:NAD(P)-dependent oxidoreductase [Rubricoccus marinus]OZC04163.1 hypothetical protein BSZ36_14940 [Rubricoccus marinus]